MSDEKKAETKAAKAPVVETVPVRFKRKTRGFTVGQVVEVSPEVALELIASGHAEDPAN